MRRRIRRASSPTRRFTGNVSGPPFQFPTHDSSFHVLCQAKLNVTLCHVSRTPGLISGDTNVKYIYSSPFETEISLNSKFYMEKGLSPNGCRPAPRVQAFRYDRTLGKDQNCMSKQSCTCQVQVRTQIFPGTILVHPYTAEPQPLRLYLNQPLVRPS